MKKIRLITVIILSLAGVLNAQYIDQMGFPTNIKHSYVSNTDKSTSEITTTTIVNVIPSPTQYIADIAFDGTLIWVEGYAEYYLYGLNPATGEIVETIAIDIRRPYGLTFDGSHFWVLDNDDKKIEKINRTTGLVDSTIFLDVTQQTYPTGVDVFDNSIWYNDTRGVAPDAVGDLTRKTNIQGVIISDFSNGLDYPSGIVNQDNYIWVTDNYTQEIHEINIETMEERRVILAPGGIYPNGLTFDGQYLWVSNNDADSIYQIDIGVTATIIYEPVLQDIYAECSATVETPITTTNNADTIYGVTTDSQTYTEQGTHTITWTFSDNDGNLIETTQNVIIEDNTNPTINCVSNITVMANTGTQQYTVQGNEFNPDLVYDNCEVDSVYNNFNLLNTLSDAVFNLGTTSVDWIVTDKAGNSSTCTYTITVETFTNIDNAKLLPKLSLYPNPNNGNFTIELNGKQTNIYIVDVTGKTVKQFETNSTSYKVSVENLQSGLYYVKINNEAIKFIKE